MKYKVLFTIVIANYNHGKYLENAIKSVVSQSSSNYELIVIDALSTDNSIDIIKKNEHHISYWVSEKDSGQSEAFNKGFKKASGNFLLWLNADDMLLPDALKNATNCINLNSKFHWFAANTIFFNVNNEILKCTNGHS